MTESDLVELLIAEAAKRGCAEKTADRAIETAEEAAETIKKMDATIEMLQAQNTDQNTSLMLLRKQMHDSANALNGAVLTIRALADSTEQFLTSVPAGRGSRKRRLDLNTAIMDARTFLLSFD